MKKKTITIIAFAILSAFSCSANKQQPQTPAQIEKQQVQQDSSIKQQTPSALQRPEAFIDYANSSLRDVLAKAEQAQWNYLTNINDNTRKLSTEAENEAMQKQSELVEAAASFPVNPSDDQRINRQINLLRSSITLPPPKDPEKRARLAAIRAEMVGYYGSATYTENNKKYTITELSNILANSRNYDELLFAWKAWHSLFKNQRKPYMEFVELANQGAVDIGYQNVADLWLSSYDMDPEAFEKEIDKIWEELKPLYQQLHCYTRAKLASFYGEDKVPLDKPIPAHLLGNMWAQEWNNIYPILAPYPKEPSIDTTKAITEKNLSAVEMTQLAENFFISLGMKHLPKSFWLNSLFTKPQDREVVCHASAWDMDFEGDVRVKMCIQPTYEDFQTIQHELGHIYYYLYYNHLPVIFQQGANDGFHEGIGDTITLSMTPEYLTKIDLLKNYAKESQKSLINRQMSSALEKIAFLPFGYLIDKWRWEIFSGRLKPENANRYWWELREKYQGIRPATPITEDNFDPAAKYHIPNNTPYLRYFLARILQFQFHKALCDAAGHKGPLYDCTIYNNKEAGNKLMELLSKGTSQPWQQTLLELTGTNKMSAEALLEYYQPLIQFLEEENKNRQCSW